MRVHQTQRAANWKQLEQIAKQNPAAQAFGLCEPEPEITPCEETEPEIAPCETPTDSSHNSSSSLCGQTAFSPELDDEDAFKEVVFFSLPLFSFLSFFPLTGTMLYRTTKRR